MTRLSLRQMQHNELQTVERSAPAEQPTVERWQRGQTLVEYALIIALVAIVVIAALLFLGPAIADTFKNIGNSL